MSDQDDRTTRVGLWAAGLTAGIAAVAVIAHGMAQSKAHVAQALQASTQAQHFEPAPPSAAFSGEVEVVKAIYFEVGQSALTPEGLDTVLNVAGTLLDDGGNVVLSGYHDASGSAQVNAEVSKQRAIAVRDALVAQGVPTERIQLAKPVVLLGGDRPEEARRVDITIVR